MTFSARYLTMTMIVEMTVQNLTTSLFSDHPGKQWVSGHQKIPSCQHLEMELQQLIEVLRQHNPYILSIGRAILSRRRRMNGSVHRWHPRWYPMQHLNE